MADTDQETIPEKISLTTIDAPTIEPSKCGYYGSPFDDADADVILRSSDHTDFRVYKAILAKASPFFRDMFSLPQSEAESPDSERDGVPVIPVEEETTTLAALLHLCYPVQYSFKKIYNLSTLGSTIRAARKYDMERAYDIANAFFVYPSLFKSHPAQAFGVAWRCRLETQVRAAARECLHGKMSLESLGHDLKFIEGEGLFELSLYHRKCRKVERRVSQVRFAFATEIIPFHSHLLMHTPRACTFTYRLSS
ncbi:hypothetical protein EW146_g5717 [Bondarzewia mesenterica]|uniref:BTB domain-containing protein n=1 Tax=Bondarzewia mesenterica TaxID=1095465 RepID=A0A4S4LRN2_9AGAM|nr:hypothetical protein EW146_g5717 [Bondarzewia mesenterica]